jgi:molybdopterin synthase sulfur carrier subunit
MARVSFTAHRRRVAPPGPVTADGATIGEVLALVFAASPRLAGYVLDDQGRLRKHVCVFVDGARLGNGTALDHPVSATSEIHVLQALSGG